MDATRDVGAPTDSAFTAAVSAITDAFGDPTRRRIYLFTRDSHGDEGVTVSAVATEVGVHPNVARHHLDKLAAGGYVEVVRRDVGTAADPGRRAGRPSKRYVAVSDAAIDVPVRSDDLVLALLGRALDRLPRHEAEAMAEEVGATYGRAMAVGPHRRRSRRRPTVAALGDAGRRRCPDGPRLRRPHGRRRPRQRPADHQRPLPVRHGRHRPPGDLRRRPRHGPGDAQRAVRRGADVEVATEASKARGDTFCATAV